MRVLIVAGLFKKFGQFLGVLMLVSGDVDVLWHRALYEELNRFKDAPKPLEDNWNYEMLHALKLIRDVSVADAVLKRQHEKVTFYRVSRRYELPSSSFSHLESHFLPNVFPRFVTFTCLLLE